MVEFKAKQSQKESLGCIWEPLNSLYHWKAPKLAFKKLLAVYLFELFYC